MNVGLAVYRQQFAALVGVPRFGDDEHQRATLARVALVNVDAAPSHGDELVRDPRTHAASRTATTSTAICASDCTSLSQITPVAAGYGAANTSRLTSAGLRYAASPAGVTNSVVFPTASSPLPSVARSLPIRA